MKRILTLFAIFILNIYTLYGNENAKYEFSIYLLLKGKMVKNMERYDFGYMIPKAFPLCVKEFLLTSKYYNLSNETIKKTAENILANIKPEHRKKNAYFVTAEVFNFIKSNFTNNDIQIKPINNSHSIFLFASEAIKQEKANQVEKCRIAVSLLRYLSIPGRMSFWNNHYVVEYYLQPLKGKGHWFIMDFEKDDIKISEEYINSVEWFPLDKDEVLNEEWAEKEVFLQRTDLNEIFLENDEKIAKEKFEAFKNNEIIKGDEGAIKKFFILRKIKYELYFPFENKDKIEIKFVLPFNNRYVFKNENSEDDFKTVDYFVKSESDKLKIKYKRTHTRINPPQTGIIYTLPVLFEVE